MWQSETESRLKKLRPGYSHYQMSSQTQRQEKLGASQDKSKLSHSNDWCAKIGSNTNPLDTEQRSTINFPKAAKKKVKLTPNIMSPYDIHTHIVHITGAAAMCRISRLLGFEKLLPATAVSIAPVAEDQKSHPDCLCCYLLVLTSLF